MTRLRPSSSPNADDAMAQCLKNAYAPSELDDAVHQDLLDRALGAVGALDGDNSTHDGAAPRVSAPSRGASELDGDNSQTDLTDGDEALGTALASEEEEADAALLAGALDGQSIHPLLSLATVLRAAYSPTGIAPERALELRNDAIRRQRLQSIRVLAYAGALVAAAIGVVFGWSTHPMTETAKQPSMDQLSVSRSVAPLLREMEQQSTATDRVDRIYSMRSRELRHNRFVAWGVR